MELIFEDTVGKISNADELNVLLNMPFDFYDKATDIKFSVEFKNHSSKLNLEGLVDENETISEIYYDTINNLLVGANVFDSRFFMSLLLDTMDSDLEERLYSSELHLKDPYFRNGTLDSQEQLKYILDFYAKEREDANIYKIPWFDIISFEDRGVDINYINPRLLGAILPDMAAYQIDEITAQKEELITSLDELDIYDEQKERLKFFDVGVYGTVLGCSVDFSMHGDSMHANFIYDIKEKKIRDVRVRFYKKES